MESYTTREMQHFNYLISETNAAYHEAAFKLGISDSTMHILYAICNSGDRCLLSDICRLSGTSKQTINSALRKLEGEGIVYLEASDGRKKRACLTGKGKGLAEDTAVRLIEIENSIFDSWPKEELELYLELTRKYLDAFKERIQQLEICGEGGEVPAETGGGGNRPAGKCP